MLVLDGESEEEGGAKETRRKVEAGFRELWREREERRRVSMVVARAVPQVGMLTQAELGWRTVFGGRQAFVRVDRCGT